MTTLSGGCIVPAVLRLTTALLCLGCGTPQSSVTPAREDTVQFEEPAAAEPAHADVVAPPEQESAQRPVELVVGSPPVPLRRLGFVDVEVEGDRGCARREDGTVACWAGRGPAEEVAGLTDAIDLVVMGSSLCVLHRTQVVDCLQEGVSTPVGPLRGAQTISSLGYSLCGELDEGIVCVSRSSEPRRFAEAHLLGYESNRGAVCVVARDGALSCTGQLAEQGTGRPLRDVQDLAISSTRGCAIAGRDLQCFRANDDNLTAYLGDGADPRRGPARVRVPLRRPKQVVMSESNTCVRDREQRVWCWGEEPLRYGVGLIAASKRPTELPDLRARDIALSGTQLCAVTAQGGLQCRGPSAPSAPSVVPGLSGVVEIASERRSSCAALEDQTVHCWGAFTPEEGRRPTVPTEVPAARGLRELHILHNRYVCGASDGQTRCVGLEAPRWVKQQAGSRVVHTYLGPLCTESSGVLRCSTSDRSTESMRGGQSYLVGPYELMCGVFDGEMRCARGEWTAETGLLPSTEPFVVLAGMEFAEARVSTVHTADGRYNALCARSPQGALRCAKVDGTEVGPLAQPIELAEGVIDFSLVDDTLCTVLAEGVRCRSVRLDRQYPLLPGRFIAIASGFDSHCVLRDDGRVLCWGASDQGQRGLPLRWDLARSTAAD